MIGLVLAAGPGRRLQPLTDALPKALLPLCEGRTLLDVALANLRSVGLGNVVVVAGFAAERVAERVADLEMSHGVRIELVVNDRAQDWNNAYSLWLAREWFAQGVLLVNGDTLHPASVETRLLDARGSAVLLAVDCAKQLGEEEMKVVVSDGNVLKRISKHVDPGDAAGEYIGVTLIESRAAEALADALEATWRRDPSLYYEDAFQELVERGGDVRVAPIGKVDWVEVDDHADLQRAREIQCRC
jgi:choline kinase